MMIRSFGKVLILAAALFSFNPLFAQEQEEEELSLDSGTLDSQFEYLLKESNNYQQYKVVPRDWMDKIRTNVTDSLRSIHNELSNLKTQIQDQQQEISSLEMELADTKSELEETQSAKNSMAFAGAVPMEKSVYRVLIWSIIGILLLLLIVFIYRFNKSNKVTKQYRNDLDEVQREMELQKKRSLEREQKISRELQDERNKNRK